MYNVAVNTTENTWKQGVPYILCPVHIKPVFQVTGAHLEKHQCFLIIIII